MNLKDTGIKSKLLETKAGILTRLDATEFTDGVCVIEVSRKHQPIVEKACEQLREEFTKRNVTVQIAIREDKEEEKKEEKERFGGVATTAIVAAFSLACEQLSEFNGVPAVKLRESFVRLGHQLVSSMSGDEFEAFLKEKFPLPPEAG